MPPLDDIKKNLLLAALPAVDFERVIPLIEAVDLELGAVLYEPGEKLKYLYFPTTMIVSLLYVTKNGDSTELAVTGFEGAVGMALFMGGNTTNSRAVVQSAGLGYRLPSAVMDDEFRRGGSFQWLLLRYAGVDHADDPDRGLQPTPLARSAAVSLVADQPRSPEQQHAADDAADDRQHARRATGRGDGIRAAPAAFGRDPLLARRHHHRRPRRPRSARLRML